MDLTYKGTKPIGVTLMGKGRPMKAPVSWESVSLPNRPGAVLIDKKIEPVIVPVRLLIEGADHEDYLRKMEEVADWLDAEKPEPLKFTDNPNRTYFAVPQGDFSPSDELVVYSEMNIEFYCPDPYKYADPKVSPFVDGAAVIYNQGSINAGPIIKAGVLQPISYMDVFTDEAYMRIGKPPQDGQPIVESQRLAFHSKFDNLTGWSALGTTVDGGTVTGTYAVSGGTFIVSNYGTAAGEYHGPALKQAIPGNPLTDFRVDFHFRFPTPRGKHGRIECYLLDDQGNHIGKLAMKNRYNNPNNMVEVRIGGGSTYTFIFLDYGGSRKTEWDDFHGMIRLSRKGNVYDVYIAKIDEQTRKHTFARTANFVDEENLYAGNLSQVQVHSATWGTQEAAPVAATDLTVFEHMPVPSTDPNIIAVPGDEIEIDFPNSAIYINGEERKDLKDIAARFFKMKPGTHALLLEPFASLDATATIREGFK